MIGIDRFQASEVCPDEMLRYAMTWRIHRPVDRYYQMFIHIRDVDTHQGLVGIDVAPLQDYPTQEWNIAHQIVLGDTVSLQLPGDTPPGTYYVATGFYNTDTLERLNIVDENGAVVGSEVTIDQIIVPESCE